MAAVKLSKTTEKPIRAPWSRALIVKVCGRSIGLNFLQTKLLALWKPVGRLVCVDLEKEFFLVRFSLKEDHDSVLRRGPWFLGGTFPFYKALGTQLQGGDSQCFDGSSLDKAKRAPH